MNINLGAMVRLLLDCYDVEIIGSSQQTAHLVVVFFILCKIYKEHFVMQKTRQGFVTPNLAFALLIE